jgi:MoaA/NifB/PqqE/SkfB family radical SAM enzyme
MLGVGRARTAASRRPLASRVREAAIVARAALDEDRPLLVHIIPMRRCNLACAYCNEYDDHSDPVPLPVMRDRIDRLAMLGTAVVTISGGEPLLHPEIDRVIAYIHERGMVCTLITNGYLLGPERIRDLNRAQLDRLQISIDNVKPDAVSKKSLKTLDRKLEHLAEHAAFDVNINSVVGAGVAHPEDALTIAKRARALGFTATMGIIHDGTGHLRPLSAAESRIYDEFRGLNRLSITRFNSSFQDNLAAGRHNAWRCRAGSRYFYVCEDGLVHYCSQRRGEPAIPLAEYTLAHLRRFHREEKPCAPYCTIACVHQSSSLDRFRSPQRPAPPAPAASARDAGKPLVQLRTGRGE